MRLFLALPLPKDIVKYITSVQSGLSKKQLRLPESLHLTVKFLGEFEDVDKVKDIVAKIKSKQFKLKLDGVGAFPDWTKPRVLWIGVDPKEHVLAVQKATELALADMFPAEEKFHPHITLARVKDDIDVALTQKVQNLSIDKKEFLVDRMVLYGSKLTRQGPIHTELLSIKFDSSK